ncbi:MAG: hypothetical protein Q8O76_05870 [Chloroflexota bacterium]|nr:hypothetical protein [Chloroflexota bacterium]
MIALDIFLLLLTAIAVRFLGRKLLPLVMPPGRLKPLLLAWAGAAAGNLVERLLWAGSPALGGLHPIGAAAGALLCLIVMAIIPFFKVLAGRTQPPR